MLRSTMVFNQNRAHFLAEHAVLVQESPVYTAAFRGPLALGANNVVAPIVAAFEITAFPGTRSQAVCTLDMALMPPLYKSRMYFLPYLPDGATTMTLPVHVGPATSVHPGFFATSTLTGCTVQVYGPANNPTITHANAVTTFTTGGGALAAQTAINGMLPAIPVGQPHGTLTRAHYHAVFTGAHWPTTATASAHLFPKPPTLSPTPHIWRLRIKPQLTAAGEGQVGVFVYGERDPGTGDWEFYYQTSVEVRIALKLGLGRLAKKKNAPYMNEAVVIGNPIRFF